MSWFVWTGAGVGLFLLGMKGAGAQLSALLGTRLERWLNRAARTQARGMLTGALCTALTQSSDATNSLVIELLSQSRLSLERGAALMMGAQVGTTLTGHLTAWQAGSWGALLILPGALMRTLGGRRHGLRTLGGALSGLGMMLLGIEMAGLGCAQVRLSESGWAQGLLRGLSRPGTALLLSVLLTAGLQSSSAFVGLLQAVCAAGALDMRCAPWMMAGGALGSCVTELLIAADTSADGRHAALFYLLFNGLGAALALCAMRALPVEEWLYAWSGGRDAAYLAGVNTALRALEVLLTAPLLTLLTAAARKLLPDGDPKAGGVRLRHG